VVGAITLASAMVACGSNGDDAAAGGQDLGLMSAGTLRIGTLTDAPPNVYVKDGKFTGFDNDLITAVAAKLNLKPEFVGTDFSALLSQVNGGQFDLGSSSITITEARKKTVAFSNGYDFGYLGLNTTKDSGITSPGAGRTTKCSRASIDSLTRDVYSNDPPPSWVLRTGPGCWSTSAPGCWRRPTRGTWWPSCCPSCPRRPRPRSWPGCGRSAIPR